VSSEHRLPPILDRIKSEGHAVFTDGAYNLNLFGIRSRTAQAGRFDDLMGCAYRATPDGPFRVHWWAATTDPGVYWLENPMKVSGTAILVPGQYRGCWKVGLHGGKYEALCQRGGKVRVYRDSDKDQILDMNEDSVAEGWFGINLHASSQRGDGTGESSVVGKWSAGCQVHATESGFRDMMRLVHLQQEHHPRWTRYTYTLLQD
jgi:hypothetical protein